MQCIASMYHLQPMLNFSFGNADRKNRYQITCQQVWQSFVQEFVWIIATSIDPNNNLELDDKLNISEVPGQAFHYLGQGGQIHSASGHTKRTISCTL